MPPGGGRWVVGTRQRPFMSLLRMSFRSGYRFARQGVARADVMNAPSAKCPRSAGRWRSVFRLHEGRMSHHLLCPLLAKRRLSHGRSGVAAR